MFAGAGAPGSVIRGRPPAPGPIPTPLVIGDPSPASALARMVADHDASTGVALAQGDPERLILATVAAEVARSRALINDAAAQNLLPYARGPHLDGLAALVGVTRKAPTPAVTVLRFHRAPGVSGEVDIPTKTRVKPEGGTATFETDSAVTIAEDLAFADVTATAVASGVAANGLLPGQLRRGLALPPGVGAVENVVATGGGTDLETDDELRARVPLALAAHAAAGPAEAYRQVALAAHHDVADAAVVSPEAGRVVVVPVGASGAVLPAAALDEVLAAVSADDVRPVCDRVEVTQPGEVQATLALSWWGERSANARLAGVQAEVAAAVAAYRAWQGGALGRDIAGSRLAADVQRIDGVKRVEVTDAEAKGGREAFVRVGRAELARVQVEVHFGGAEEA